MSETQERTPLELAGAGCVGVYGLVVVLLLVTVLVWRSSVITMTEQAQHDGELWRADATIQDASRARMLARSGVDSLLVALRSGAQPSSPLKGVLGASYADGEDRYEVTFKAEPDGVYAVEVTGQVIMRDWGSDDDRAQKLRGECVIKARLKVDGEQVSVLSLKATDTSPEPPWSD